jgi:hypothetical protein
MPRLFFALHVQDDVILSWDEFKDCYDAFVP